MNDRLAETFRRVRYWMTPLLENCPEIFFPQRERQLQVYVVGMPRSGTVSLYDIFKGCFRSGHEPESRFLTRKVVAHRLNRLDEKGMRRYLRRRDRRLGLELDTSYLNGEVVGMLVEEFPDARFILTIRDCYSWTDSMMNFLLNKPEFMTSRKAHIREHMEIQFGSPPYIYAPEEEALQTRQLHPLSRYLKYWAEHNQRVIDLVPKERLLVLRTNEIAESNVEIEKFLDLPAGTLEKSVHSNAAPTQYSLLGQVPSEFLRSQVQAHCSVLMNQYFPEVMGRLQ